MTSSPLRPVASHSNETSVTIAIVIMRVVHGMIPVGLSQLPTALRLTFSWLASSACVIPFLRRARRIRLAR
ncbi:hypothetical protein D3C81_841750 [compost metagenome]